MNKLSRIKIWLAAFAVIAAFLSTGVTASAALKVGDSRITSAGLNLRKSASTSSDVLIVVPKGTFVKILAAPGNNWFKISYNSKTGYVSGTYLKDPFDVYGNKYSKYLSTALWLRSSPKQISSNKIMTIPTGGKVFVIAKVKDINWYKVYYGGKVGYISGGYFRGDSANTRILAKNVYLRSSPQVSSGNKIGIVKAGESVVVLSRYNQKWWKVRYGTKVGYLAVGYFKSDQDTSKTRTMSTAINLRKTRSTASSDNIIRVIPKGGTVTIVGSYSGNWYQVTYNGSTGYIKGGYFS